MNYSLKTIGVIFLVILLVIVAIALFGGFGEKSMDLWKAICPWCK